MALKQSTIDNSLNRRRFVTPEAAEPYLRHREHQNARRGVAKALRDFDEARRASTYGTSNVLTMIMRIALITQHLERCGEQLRDGPTILETKKAAARQARLIEWRARHTPATTTTESVIDRLASD